jgi:hypothetical protein
MIMTFPARHAEGGSACPDESVMIIDAAGAGDADW